MERPWKQVARDLVDDAMRARRMQQGQLGKEHFGWDDTATSAVARGRKWISLGVVLKLCLLAEWPKAMTHEAAWAWFVWTQGKSDKGRMVLHSYRLFEEKADPGELYRAQLELLGMLPRKEREPAEAK